MSQAKVLLIGWDGADWNVIQPLLDKGEMPNLARLVEEGVMGDLPSLQPMLSPMLWTSIATGMLPAKHGILGFTEVDEASGRVVPFCSASRRVKAVWNILSQVGYRTHVITWFAGHPAEPINGINLSENFPHLTATSEGAKLEIPPGVIHPPYLAEEINDLLVRPDEIDSQTIHLFVPRFGEVDQDNDQRLATIARELVRCFCVHSAATWAMEREPWDFSAVYYNTIDHFSHGFMRYHPPHQEHISQQDFELYHDVVNSTYRLHDLLLGRLLELAGSETMVVLCSDHGFHADHLRPRHVPRVPTGPVEEHRPVGILAMRGPGVIKDELIHGASPLDITPTVLAAFGLPVGQDMDGRVLVEAFESGFLKRQPPSGVNPNLVLEPIQMDSASGVSMISSWETIDGPAGMHPEKSKMNDAEAAALLDQFVALGYVEPFQGSMEEQAAVTRAEVKWNLARTHMYTGRYYEALPLMEEIYEEYPLRLDYGLRLAECQARIGLGEEAHDTMESLAAIYPDNPQARLLMGVAEFQRGDPEKALAHLLAVETAEPRLPGLFFYLGFVYELMDRSVDALDAYQRALDINPDSAESWLGRARCLLKYRLFEQVADAALHSIGLNFSLAEAHYLLGLASGHLGKMTEAVRAFETCLHYFPQHARALGHMYQFHRTKGEKATAEAYLVRLKEIKANREKGADNMRRMRDEVKERALARHAAQEEQNRRLLAEMAEDAIRFRDTKQDGIGANALAPGETGKEFVIVSGLPRSGTSLMMQMLEAGGLAPMADGIRTADEDNPAGYYEWEEIKLLPRNPRIIEKAEGKVCKVISMLLPRLPRIHRYKVIFMDRPIKEIATSQAKMLKHQKKKETDLDLNHMAGLLNRHRDTVLAHLENVEQIELLKIDYPSLVAEPQKYLDRIRQFVGPDALNQPEAMAGSVRPELYRNRLIQKK